ncbi:MAG: acyl-CoA thioesterase [Alphaproteobacteria bacterium]
MPADTNPAGDIFGGWVLAQMDIAGGILARARTNCRVATVAVDSMTFYLPVFVGDVVCCYADIERIGRTSIAVNIQAWAMRENGAERVLVTEGIYTYVAIDNDRRPRPISGD